MQASFRENALQSSKDQDQMKMMADYIESSPAGLADRFDNFTKYVQRGTLSRFLARYEVYQRILNVPGCVLDIGVGRGASLFTWCQLSEILEPTNYTREIVGFDTFEGVPSVDDRDKNAHNAGSNLIREGGFAPEPGTLEDLQKGIEVFDVSRHLGHIPKASLAKGDVTRTLPGYLEENPHLVVSLLHIDADLYGPTKTALETVMDRIPRGGVILFDELCARVYPGETVALAETIGINKVKLRRFPWATTIAYAVIE